MGVGEKLKGAFEAIVPEPAPDLSLVVPGGERPTASITGTTRGRRSPGAFSTSTAATVIRAPRGKAPNPAAVIENGADVIPRASKLALPLSTQFLSDRVNRAVRGDPDG